FGAVQVPHADGVHEQLHAVRLEHLVARALSFFLNHQAILEPRTAPTLHEYAEAPAGLVLFAQQIVDFGGRRFGYVNHDTIIATPCRTCPFLAWMPRVWPLPRSAGGRPYWRPGRTSNQRWRSNAG